MLRKNILYFFHDTKICQNICSATYPWGWKDKSLIKNYQKNLMNVKKMNINNFNEKEFINNTITPYNIIYKTYLKKLDFLEYEYTNPSLSIALNKLRNSIDLSINLIPKEIKINKTKILSNEIKEELTTSNSKFLGYFDESHLIHEITAGAIGPEVSHIWDQRPTKQVVTVLYESKDFYDILEWERDLMLVDPQWQVANINYILNKKKH